jgi:acyl-CoA thioesterase I
MERLVLPFPAAGKHLIVNKKGRDESRPLFKIQCFRCCWCLPGYATVLRDAVTIRWVNPAALYFASGDSLYPGAVLLLSAAIASRFSRKQGLWVLRGLATWLGFAMIFMACPPVSWWVATFFLAAFFVWQIASAWTRPGPLRIRLRFAATAVLVVLLLVVPISEFLHRRLPLVKGKAADHLVIIGDSISSGIDSHTPAWPIFFQRQTTVTVQNQSSPGIGAVDARAIAARVKPQDTLILVEIGGNDLLSDMPSAEFGLALDSLLSSLSGPGRTLVMFEIPLLPHKIGFGRAQRRLSAKYGVFLIPKHCFTEVLNGADATSDGLHLSESGGRRMAALVAQVLSPVLKPTEPATPR